MDLKHLEKNVTNEQSLTERGRKRSSEERSILKSVGKGNGQIWKSPVSLATAAGSKENKALP